MHGASNLWHRRLVPTKTLARPATTGQHLVVALLTVGRRLRSRLPEGRIDPRRPCSCSTTCRAGSPRVSELAGAMGLDASTASRHVQPARGQRLPGRTGDPDDRRAFRVRLTRQGQAVLDHAIEARATVLDRATAGWPDEDRAALTILMTRLADSLDRLADNPETR